MQTRVRFFAAAREAAKTSTATVELPDGATVAVLLSTLATRFPALQPVLAKLRVAVDEEFVSEETVLTPSSDVALIPPVGGGAPLFCVQEAPLSLQQAIDAVSSEKQGGLVTFSGAVRDHSRGKTVSTLEYEAYAPMAEKKLREIADEARSQWPGVEVAVLHRVGTLSPGDLAVVIAVSAPHRKEAFRACEHVIDRLKQDVPIWKKEFTEDGEVWVGLGP